MMFGDDPELKPRTNWRGEAGLKLPFYRRAWFSALLALILLLCVAALGAYSIVVQPLREEAEKLDLTELKKLEAASIIYDRNGDELARLYVLNRTPVSIKEVPQHLVDALTAQEDSRYFQHNGVDYWGVLRAIYLNLKASEVTQGASTITQQLARQTFKLTEKNYKRKIKEAFLAQRIERNFSKSEILEMYLNRIYFGGGFYGIQAAARGYFGKDVKDLAIEEAATICALIKSPNNIQPLRHPERSLKERNYVLERMSIEGSITREEMYRLQQKPLVTAPQTSDPRLSYIFEEVRQEVVNVVGEEKAAIGGFSIYTTIDKDLQRATEESMRKHLAEVEKHENYPHQTFQQFRGIIGDYRSKVAKNLITAETPRPIPEYLQGAALVMDNTDGSILAMVGGRDFGDSQYNRAIDGVRPAGTAFTPFVYAAAFSRADTYPGTQVEDKPLDNRRIMIGGLTGILGEWGSEVDDPKWSQSLISTRESLVQSRNSATVRIGERVGLEAIKKTAKDAGITSPLRDYPSTFLGASEVKLDDMCLAYSCFPTLGNRPAKMHLIQRIVDTNEKPVFARPEAEKEKIPVMDEIAAYQTHTCLVEALRRGTGSPSASYGLGDFPAAGKTGTHNEFKDLWFMGYTSAVTCGVWVGFDKQKTIYPGAFSNKIALPIWTDIMNASVLGHSPQEIAAPESAERIEICRKSGQRATDFCYDKIRGSDGKERSVRTTYVEYVRPGTNIQGYCTAHTGEGLSSDLASFHQVMSTSTDSAVLASSSRFSQIEPVRMQGLTVIGKDPYEAEQPVPRAMPVNEDGSRVLKAVPVGPDEEETPTEEPILKLKPPPPMKIEL